MANSLLNKLQSINNTRERLADILTNKGIDISSENGLPQLVEQVNNMYKSAGQGVQPWTGVDTTPPESYFVPEINIDEIYNNDTEKDNYSNVAIYLIKVNDYGVDLPKNVIQCFTRYKFSDATSSEAAVSTNQSPSHSWNANKDIIGESGEHYRYIIGYSNTSSYSLQYNNTINPFAIIVYKGQYTDLNWRNESIAPAYTELKSACKFTGNLNGNNNINYSAQTFISHAQTFANLGDRCFEEMNNLRYIYIDSDISGTRGMYHAFLHLRNCYCYIKQVSNLTNECIFYETDNCTFIFDTVNTGTREETGFNWHERTLFRWAKAVKLKIGTLNGSVGRSLDDREDAEDIEIEIGDVMGNIGQDCMRRSAINCKGIKIDRVHGSLGAQAFYQNPIIGKITILPNVYPADNPAIGSNAFAFTDIEEVDFGQSDINILGDNVFENCKKLKNIVYGRKLKSLGNNVFLGCDLIKTVILPESVTTITSETFRRAYIENIVLGIGITVIPEGAFFNTPELQYIKLGDNVTTLGNSCFAMTAQLKEIELPEHITTIPNNCFHRSGIKKVTTLGNITQIEANAFAFCEELEELDISHVQSFGATCLRDTNLDVIIPASMTSCNSQAFYACKSIKFEIEPTIDLDLTHHRMNKYTILDFFYSLPVASISRTLTISPSAYNEVTDANRKFWAGISTAYVKENTTEGKLEYCSSSTTGAKTLAAYASAKNYTIS